MGRTVVDRAAEHRRDQAWLDEAWTAGSGAAGQRRNRPPRCIRTARRCGCALFEPAEVDADAQRWFLGIVDDVRLLRRRRAGRTRWPVAGRACATSGRAVTRSRLDLLVTSVALTQWHLRHDHCARLRRRDRDRAGRLDAALPGRRQRALPAHRPGRDHAGPRRRRPVPARARRRPGRRVVTRPWPGSSSRGSRSSRR